MEVDDSEPPVETAVRDETLHIHLGPNGQPLSFEWVRYDYGQEETLDDTYYYHYDIHGNVIKVTDSSATTKISYEYDVLGEITSVTNPDGITNPFAWGGASQLIFDDVLNVYSNQAGSYMPDTGTLLGGGAPVFTNPTSGHIIQKMGMGLTETEGKPTPEKLVFQSERGYFNNYQERMMDSMVEYFPGRFTLAGLWYWSEQYENKTIDFGIFGASLKSEGLQKLISKLGHVELELNKYYDDDLWANIDIYKYGGGSMPLMNYIDNLTAFSFRAASRFTSDILHGKCGLTRNGSDDFSNRDRVDLAAVIFNSVCDYEADHGAGAIEYGTDDMREDFFNDLVNDLNDEGFNISNPREFYEDFKDLFGDMPDSDGDRIPDILDKRPGVKDKYEDDDAWIDPDGEPKETQAVATTAPPPSATSGLDEKKGVFNEKKHHNPNWGGGSPSIIDGPKRHRLKHKATPLGERFQEEKWIPWKGWRGEDFWPIPPPSPPGLPW